MGSLTADATGARVTLRDLHAAGAWVVVTGNGLAGLWSLAAAATPRLRTRALWWFTVAAEASVFGQVVLGVVMVAGREVQADQFHMFYGFVAIVAIAILYGYAQQMRHRIYLLYGFGGLFVMGLGIRAMLIDGRA